MVNADIVKQVLVIVTCSNLLCVKVPHEMMIQIHQNLNHVVNQYETVLPTQKGVVHYTHKKALYFSESVLTLDFCWAQQQFMGSKLIFDVLQCAGACGGHGSCKSLQPSQQCQVAWVAKVGQAGTCST